MSESAAPPRRPLLKILFPLLVTGWVLAAVRLALEAAAPDLSLYVGYYFGMPIALFWLGMRGRFDELSWPRFALGMLLTTLFCLTIPNLVAYGIAQFAGWTHGRFAPGIRSAPVAETTGAKIVTTLALAGGTTLFGVVYTEVAGTLFGWLPAFVRRRRARAAG
jgi:hypothetical protein